MEQIHTTHKKGPPHMKKATHMLKITYEHRIELIRQLAQSIEHLHNTREIFGLPGTKDENPTDERRAMERLCHIPIDVQYPAKALIDDLVTLFGYDRPVDTYAEVLALVTAAHTYVAAADMINAIALKNIEKAPRVSTAHLRHVQRNNPLELRTRIKIHPGKIHGLKIGRG